MNRKTVAISTVVLSALAAISFAQINQAYGQAQQSAQQQQNAQQQNSPEQQRIQEREQQRAQMRERMQQQSQLQGQQGAQAQQLNQQEEQHFLMHCASDNQFEIQAGQYIEQRAQDQQVKQLAQRLVQDHQRAQQQLEQVAKQMNINISQQMMPVQQAVWQELQQKQGPALERSFTFCQVGDHEKDILENQYVAEHAQNPQVKQFAQQQIPVLQEHLRLAMQAAEQFVPQATQAGAMMRGQMQPGMNRTRSNTGAGTSGGTSGSQNPNNPGPGSR